MSRFKKEWSQEDWDFRKSTDEKIALTLMRKEGGGEFADLWFDKLGNEPIALARLLSKANRMFDLLEDINNWILNLGYKKTSIEGHLFYDRIKSLLEEIDNPPKPKMTVEEMQQRKEGLENMHINLTHAMKTLERIIAKQKEEGKDV